jgi:2,3-bisphosphoglycerate-independent phosphoglycerate mutase
MFCLSFCRDREGKLLFNTGYMGKSKVLLMILDGWGLGDGSKSDVISNVSTPEMDSLMKEFPSTSLRASGEDVGLPEGQMGNSEVGHLNIGAGRVVYQDLVKINMECRSGDIRKNEVLTSAFSYARDNKRKVHFLGLLGDGGVHASDEHLYALCDMTKEYGLKKVFIHAFGDGRDTDPKSGRQFMTSLLNRIKGSDVKLASFVGRYYAMDRDKRWDRIKAAYDMLVSGVGKKTRDVISAIAESYDGGVTDEFIKPIVITDLNNQPVGLLEEGDVVVFTNFRNDRARELTIVLTQKDMPEYGMKTVPLHYCTMTPYDVTFTGLNVIYPKENVGKTIGEALSLAGKRQLRIAETEKYAHVTFFFSGGREEKFENEERILVPSPKVATYDQKPEMSAYEVRDEVVRAINSGDFDFICLNFANGDMVGHTGVYSAIEKAIMAVDKCVGAVVDAARAKGYEVLIIADHGNADYALNEDGTPNTAHSLNPVPLVIVSDRVAIAEEGILADVAPTILKMLDVEIPSEMTGHPLVTFNKK